MKTAHQHEKIHIYNPVWAKLLEFSPVKLFSHHRHIMFCLILAAFLRKQQVVSPEKSHAHAYCFYLFLSAAVVLQSGKMGTIFCHVCFMFLMRFFPLLCAAVSQAALSI